MSTRSGRVLLAAAILCSPFVLRDDSWKLIEIRLPPPGSRRLRRIDVRVDRLRRGLRGAEIGEVTVVR